MTAKSGKNGNGAHGRNGTATAPGPGPVIDLRSVPTRTDPGPAWMAAHGGAVSVSVVMPTLDEADNLRHVLPRLPDWIDELVLVDGGSRDDTIAVARELRPDVVVVVEARKGKGVALRTGFEAARGDIIVTLDADGSTDPGELPSFIGPLLAGADLVKGTRFAQGGGTADMDRLREAGNWCLTRLVRVLFGGRYTDLCYGYAAFWRRTLPAFEGPVSGFEIETHMNVRALVHDLRVVEVPSYEAARIHGASHLRTFSDGFRVLRTILRERWSAGPAPAGTRLDRATGGRGDQVAGERAALPLAEGEPLHALVAAGADGPRWRPGDDVFAAPAPHRPMEIGAFPGGGSAHRRERRGAGDRRRHGDRRSGHGRSHTNGGGSNGNGSAEGNGEAVDG